MNRSRGSNHAARSAAKTQLKIESLGTEEYRHAPPHLVALPRREITRNVAHMTPDQPRRAFLKTAGAIATGIAASVIPPLVVVGRSGVTLRAATVGLE